MVVSLSAKAEPFHDDAVEGGRALTGGLGDQVLDAAICARAALEALLPLDEPSQ